MLWKGLAVAAGLVSRPRNNGPSNSCSKGSVFFLGSFLGASTLML
jgi:hypothetical protein